MDDEVFAIGLIRDVCAGRVQHAQMGSSAARDVDVLVIFGSSVECPVLPSKLLSNYLDLIDEPVLVISGKRSFLVGIRELTGVLAEHVGLPIATASRTQSAEEDQALLNFLDSAVASALVQLATRLVVLAIAVLGL